MVVFTDMELRLEVKILKVKCMFSTIELLCQLIQSIPKLLANAIIAVSRLQDMLTAAMLNATNNLSAALNVKKNMRVDVALNAKAGQDTKLIVKKFKAKLKITNPRGIGNFSVRYTRNLFSLIYEYKTCTISFPDFLSDTFNYCLDSG